MNLNLFKQFKSKFQIGLRTSWKVMLSYSVHLLCCKCHEINPNCGGYYIDSSNLIKMY